MAHHGRYRRRVSPTIHTYITVVDGMPPLICRSEVPPERRAPDITPIGKYGTSLEGMEEIYGVQNIATWSDELIDEAAKAAGFGPTIAQFEATFPVIAKIANELAQKQLYKPRGEPKAD